jgi:DNA-binding LacI/PurR family transcriptional regulator
MQVYGVRMGPRIHAAMKNKSVPSKTPNPATRSSRKALAESATGRVQMVDVARMAGVSTATVSRALSGSSSIPESTRQRISEIASRIGYRINHMAASFRRGQTNSIGVVVLAADEQPQSDPFILGLVGHIADVLNAQGMNLLLTRVRQDHKGAMEALFNSGQVAGLLVIGQNQHHGALNALEDAGIPLVVWGALLPETRYALVGGENLAGGIMATELLLAKGARRILFLGDTRYPEGRLRFEGYAKALKKHGLKADKALQCHCLLSAPVIESEIRRKLDARVAFDAVFVSSDVGALTVISTLGKLNILVPHQIRVVGYDNIDTAAYSHPTLTTIHQPIDLAASALVELLREKIDGAASRVLVLPAQLIERDSTR